MIDRIKLVPFLARFENSAVNRDYIKELMTTCLDQFFSWFVDGAHEWYNGKSLVPCKVMDHEMSAYINELDIQSQFIDERIEIISKEKYESTPMSEKMSLRVKKEALFMMFTAYTMELGIKPKITKNDFNKGLEKYGIVLSKVKGIWYYLCREKNIVGRDDDNE